MSDGEQQPPVRRWPHGRDLSDDEVVELSCAACRTPWRVQDKLRGFRLRCDCGAWLEIPGPMLPATTPEVPQELPALPRRAATRRDATALVELPGDDGDIAFQRISTDAAMAPGTLRRASPSNQARWTNRTIAEFVLLMMALLGPQLAALLFSRGNEFELLLPFTSLISGVLVMLVMAWAGPYGRLGLLRTSGSWYAQALLAAAIAVAIAIGYVHVLERLLPDLDTEQLHGLIERLGLVASLFVIAVSPAVLEEIVFRGMLQARLMALFGRGVGLLVTASAFALCHGAPAVLPIHIGLGLYLGILRERSGSLLPSMLMHFAYNGTLVVLET